jgi:phosphatidylglycerol:prolipoprotein diacylglycerol transferase
VHPELFHLRAFGLDRPIYSYGALVVLGIALGIALGMARAPRFGLPRFDALALGLCAVIGGLVGGVLLYDAVHFRLLLADPALLFQPGLVFYGGLVGGAGAAALYCRAYKLSLPRAADVLAPGLAFGHALGRIGCLMGGCCYGRPVASGFPLAVELAGATRLPVQLYEATGLVVLGSVLLLLPRALTRHAGAVFACYLAGYALLRLCMEPLRGDDFERGFVVPGRLSTSQAIAALTFSAAVVLLYRLVTRKGAD